MRWTVAALLAAAAATPACSADPGASPDAEEAEGELRGAKVYDCRTFNDGDDVLARFELALTSGKAKLIDLSKDALVPDVGSLDTDYAPTSPQYAGASRYQGFRELVRDMDSDIGSLELIVSGDVQSGAAEGKIWIRMSGHGGSSTQARCTKVAAVRAVKTSTPARLACDLDHIICAGDNPPGDTCLVDLFVQEQSDGAKARLKWYDHFGVRATERTEQLGGSSQFDRTKKSVKGAWGEAKLELSYRAGITYTGKFTLADGRHETVKCNDLGMLD